MAEDHNNGLGTAFLAFTLGAVIGGGLALLTAPRSGPETREKLHGMLDETRGKLNVMTEDAENRIKKAVKEGRDLIEENADLIKAAVKAGKDAISAEKAKQEKSA
jgi:gas vesicle protein